MLANFRSRCGTCQRSKGIGIFKVPAAKDEKYKSWREQWLSQITKMWVVYAGFKRQILEDKVFRCEKHFKPEEIKISKSLYSFIKICLCSF